MPFLSRTLATLLVISCGTVAGATELKVLGAEAFKPAFEALAGGFERASGHKLQFVYATGGLLRDRIRAGETADVIILPKPTFDPLQAEGYIGREGSATSRSRFSRSLYRLGAPSRTSAAWTRSSARCWERRRSHIRTPPAAAA